MTVRGYARAAYVFKVPETLHIDIDSFQPKLCYIMKHPAASRFTMACQEHLGLVGMAVLAIGAVGAGVAALVSSANDTDVLLVRKYLPSFNSSQTAGKGEDSSQCSGTSGTHHAAINTAQAVKGDQQHEVNGSQPAADHIVAAAADAAEPRTAECSLATDSVALKSELSAQRQGLEPQGMPVNAQPRTADAAQLQGDQATLQVQLDSAQQDQLQQPQDEQQGQQQQQLLVQGPHQVLQQQPELFGVANGGQQKQRRPQQKQLQHDAGAARAQKPLAETQGYAAEGDGSIDGGSSHQSSGGGTDRTASTSNSTSNAEEQEPAAEASCNPRVLLAPGSSATKRSALPVLRSQRSIDWLRSPRVSGSDSQPATPRDYLRSSTSGKLRACINATRQQPSLDSTVASAVVAANLQMHYAEEPTAPAPQQIHVQQVCTPLATLCAQLCKQHCKKLQDGQGELGETTVLDIGCGTGGTCFQLALSFSHVLGIDGDPMHVVAAKELKEKGQLVYHPVSESQCDAATARSIGCTGIGVQQDVACVARVSDDIDRDIVRFWQYPLPDLPPKLQPVDAVLVEDVDGRLGHGLRHVLEQVPALLNPQGLCVVVLPAASATKDAVAGRHADVPQQQHHSMPLQDVQTWLQENGLTYVTQQVLHYPVSGSTGSAVGIAHAGVWVQSS